MDTALFQEVFSLAETQGRPAPLQVITAWEGKTVNMEPRRSNPPVWGVCFHETATPEDVDMPSLMAQHQGSRFPTSWNGGIGLNAFYSFVPVRTHLAWAQGISAVEGNDWDSMDCKVLLYSLEVCGVNQPGVRRSRAQILLVVQFMWWADMALGIRIEEWRKRYFTHRGIGRFATPPYPHQKPGRKHDPEGYDPFILVAQTLGQNNLPDEPPPTGIYKITSDSATVNVRSSTQLNINNIIAKRNKGESITIVSWSRGDEYSGSHWWVHLKDGGFIHGALLSLQIGVPSTPNTGAWWVHVSSANAYLHSDLSTSVNTRIGSLPNRRQVNIVEWRLGENVQGTAWWGRRAEGGWLSMAVLTSTPPAIAAPLASRMQANATLLQNRFLPFTRTSDVHVACNEDDHDDA